ncbi:MAG: hypothetical protein ACTTH0_05055 [Eubacteriales bacterium]
MQLRGIVKERSPLVRGAIFVIALMMLGLEIWKSLYIYIPITLLVALVPFFHKAQIISDVGIDVEYRLFNSIMHNIWKWEEITTLHADYRKAGANVMLHIGKDIVTRTFVVTPSDAIKAKEIARKYNPQIYIEDIV